MQTYVTPNDMFFLHDIVESFSSMINVAFVIFLNSPTASSIVPCRYLNYVLSVETRGLHCPKHR